MVDLRITIPGGYQKLLDEISIGRRQIEEEKQCECSIQESAESWYREIYLPFEEAVRERGMMRWFPNRTVTDLYVWMTDHRSELEKELGWSIRPEAAAEAVIQIKNRRASAEEEERVQSARPQKGALSGARIVGGVDSLPVLHRRQAEQCAGHDAEPDE